MSRKATAALLALLSGLGLALVAGEPAQASYSQCPSMYACLFNGVNGIGTPTDFFYRSPGTCYTITIAAANNTADSVFNDLTNGHHIQVYDGANCDGVLLETDAYGKNPIPAGHHTNFINSAIVNYRNRASSVWFNNG